MIRPFDSIFLDGCLTTDKFLRGMILFLVLLSCYPYATSATTSERSVFAVTHENDLYANRDQFYTSGIRLAWFSRQDQVPPWFLRFSRSLGLYNARAEHRMVYGFGQNLYTPRDISLEEPTPEDRPYAGWLYSYLGHIQDHGELLEAYEVQLGIVGPSAQGERTQRVIHRLFGSENPAGWDNQLRDELGVRLSYGQTWAAFETDLTRSTRIQVMPGWALSLGNVQTAAQISGSLRWGDFSGNDYGPPLIRSVAPGTGFFALEEPFEWYTYLHLSGRYVAHEIFLDGNTLHDGPEVDRKPWIGEAQLGVVLSWNPYRVSYTHVIPTREFEGQDKTDDYGAVTVSIRF